MLDKLIAQAQGYEQWKTNFQVHTADLGVDPRDGTLMMASPMGTTVLKMTDWAKGQMYGRLEPVVFNTKEIDSEAHWRGRKTWKDYLEACPKDMWALNMAHWLGKADQDWYIRAFKDNARAVLSKRFAPVDTLECLQWTKQALDTQPGLAVQFRNVYLDENTLRASILVRDLTIPQGKHDGKYGVGVDIGTGEIGNHTLWARPFVQRTSCMNSITVNTDMSFEHRHIGVREHLARSFVLAVWDAVRGTEDVLRRLVSSLEEPLPQLTKVIDDMATRNGWSEDTAYAVAMGTENENSLWGLVQGVSYAANQMADIEAQMQMHSLAGRLLMTQDAFTGQEV